MKIKVGKEEEYKNWKDKNEDSYGRAIFNYLECWANLMETEIENQTDKTPEQIIPECANELSSKADVEGITGFMYGAAVQILSKEWEYGEILRKWHNGEYNYEGEGTVNPAIITIK